MTADHGGAGTTHSDATLRSSYRVPFLVWGADVAPGADLYALNPDRQNPGTSQPPYDADVAPIRNGDAANLVTDLLELPPLAGSTLNADQSLDVALP